MFKFVVGVCLIAATILGWSFYGEYRSNNMTEAQIEAAQIAKAERAEAREARAELRRKALTSSFMSMETPEGKGVWLTTWIMVVGFIMMTFAAYYLLRKKVFEPVWYRN